MKEAWQKTPFLIIAMVGAFLIFILKDVDFKGNKANAQSTNEQPPVKENPFHTFRRGTKLLHFRDKIKEYVKTNENLDAKNIRFLHKYENMLRPCPLALDDIIKVQYTDTGWYASAFQIAFQPREYLNNDPEMGQIDNFGIKFNVDDSTGLLNPIGVFHSFVKFAKNGDYISSNIFDYGSEYPDIAKKYGSKIKIKETETFYKNVMRKNQVDNKHKCK
jgi:hypothetical protein